MDNGTALQLIREEHARLTARREALYAERKAIDDQIDAVEIERHSHRIAFLGVVCPVRMDQMVERGDGVQGIVVHIEPRGPEGYRASVHIPRGARYANRSETWNVTDRDWEREGWHVLSPSTKPTP